MSFLLPNITDKNESNIFGSNFTTYLLTVIGVLPKSNIYIEPVSIYIFKLPPKARTGFDLMSLFANGI
jgi:hypothetical protein